MSSYKAGLKTNKQETGNKKKKMRGNRKREEKAERKQEMRENLLYI